MPDIRALTEGYVAAFDSRDTDAVAGYFAPNFALTDPEVTNLTPKSAARDYVGGLFAANETLSFVAHRIVVEGSTSVIHFQLTLGTTVLDGVDLITWQGEQMSTMHAY
ncbi:nuclear transport factor 2 family protein [Sedimentitalea todarodis]|uniref:Nuclear transport factor 2 family protein n=1 Tax=Sedimentitalea todarodis TaxID=1631240 RepID=A0ABU3VGD7_9RHOB|nr:nuclear transport factor 2 family protein [Sedimentitalea todarodis]MDU9005239.1 nuclear transport factor 2 family protein [Sedimentitalea todarodis]